MFIAQSNNKLFIFGAQGYALGAYEAIRTLYPDKDISCFLVSTKGMNADTLAGLPVKEIDKLSKTMSDSEKSDALVLIATPENAMSDIEIILEKYGFYSYQRLNSERWADLVGKYHAVVGDMIPFETLHIGEETTNSSGYQKTILEVNWIDSIRVYMAKTYADMQLINEYNLPPYMTQLQVGAALTDQIICECRDNGGQGISHKNKNYSELTGLYWIWKNVLCNQDNSGVTECRYIGFAQYRRILILSEKDIRRVVYNDIDVVLPYPLPYEPDINAHHERYLKPHDWKALLTALKELQPNYAMVFPEVLNQRYLYNYNIILAKSDVLRDYCEWLFPILERVEELSEPKGWERADRYIGYMAESLETLYFMKNKDKLKIAHTGVKMLV